MLDMMTSFLNETIGGSDPISLGHETGYIYDILTGSYLKDLRGNTVLNRGSHPRNTTVVAPSGKGKTTQEIQLVSSIVNDIPNGHVIFLDGETHTTPTRVKQLTGWSNDHYRNKFTLKSGPVSMVDVYNIIIQVVGFKKKNAKALKYNSGYRDHDGTPLFIFPPTIILLDSVANLISPGAVDIHHDKQGNVKNVETVVNNIDAMRDAKINTNMIKKIKGHLKDYNIHFRMINHLIETPAMGMFDIPKKHHPNLKPGQRLKGGDEMIYQTAYMPEYYGTVEKLNERNPAYGDGIRGEVMRLRFIKNKSMSSNTNVRIVFDNYGGQLPEATDFENLREHGSYGVGGSGRAFFLEAYPEVTFKRSTLIETCRKNPRFARALQFTTRYLLLNKIHFKKEPKPMSELREGFTDRQWNSMVNKSTRPYPFYTTLYNTNEIMHDFDSYDPMIDELGVTNEKLLPIADEQFWEDVAAFGVTDEFFKTATNYVTRFDLKFDKDGYSVPK